MTSWHEPYEALPSVHDRVQFFVTGHTAGLYGTFEEHCFRSRWASYAAAAVSKWRALDEDAQRASTHQRTRDTLYWSERPMRGA